MDMACARWWGVDEPVGDMSRPWPLAVAPGEPLDVPGGPNALVEGRMKQGTCGGHRSGSRRVLDACLFGSLVCARHLCGCCAPSSAIRCQQLGM